MNPRTPAPEHPGQLLRQRMREARVSANQLAADIGTPTNRLTKIINGERGISADSATRLAHWFGGNPWEWMEAQARYDLHLAAKALKRKLARMTTREMHHDR